MTARGGLVTLEVLDAARNPITLDMPGEELLGYTSFSHEDQSTTLHRLDAARFAECGSYVGAIITADEIIHPTGITLCWYCFPRS